MVSMVKPFAKISKKETGTSIPAIKGFINELKQKINNNASVVEWPLVANCRGSIFGFDCGTRRLQKNPSIIFARLHVRDIGRKSLSIDCGGDTLGMGDIIEDLSNSGIYPYLID